MVDQSINLLAVIPVRGGSKGFPGKNALRLGSKHLIRVVAEVVLDSNQFDGAICSTDSEELAEIARFAGLDVPFLRPKELSDDLATTSDVAIHALLFMEEKTGRSFSHVFVFQATSPFLRPDMINRAVNIIQTRENVDSIICGYQVPDRFNADLQFEVDSEGFVDHDSSSLTIKRRQESRNKMVRTGNLYATRSDFLRASRQLVGGNTYCLPIEPRFSLDIDSEEDWMEAIQRFEELEGENAW